MSALAVGAILVSVSLKRGMAVDAPSLLVRAVIVVRLAVSTVTVVGAVVVCVDVVTVLAW